MTHNEQRYWTYAWWLALATVAYNILEAYVALWFGVEDEALALFGFGADALIEVVSALGVAHYIARLRKNGSSQRDQFERTALRITGGAFYALCVVLSISAALSIIYGHVPQTTIPGLVISGISLASMWALIRGKIHVGTVLGSAPIIADANCSRVCMQMSIVLLVSSAVYELTGLGMIDAVGALGLVWYSWKEGRECFAKARGMQVCDDGCH